MESVDKRAMAIHPGKEKEEEIVKPALSSFAPCINGCIGVPLMKTRESVPAADCDHRLISVNHED